MGEHAVINLLIAVIMAMGGATFLLIPRLDLLMANANEDGMGTTLASILFVGAAVFVGIAFLS